MLFKSSWLDTLSSRSIPLVWIALLDPFFVTLFTLCLAFLLAANVVLDIKGETSDIQNHFSTSTTSGRTGFGFGPFSFGGSYSRTNTEENSTCETTATGCRSVFSSRPCIIIRISNMPTAVSPSKLPKSLVGFPRSYPHFHALPKRRIVKQNIWFGTVSEGCRYCFCAWILVLTM